MNPSCFNVILAVVFLQMVVGQEDFSQFEQQFKQLSESLNGGTDLSGGGNGTGLPLGGLGGMQNDAPAAQQPPADQPAVEPTRLPKPEEASTFPPLARQDAKANSTEVPKEAATTPKSTTPKGDGGAGFTGANFALVCGFAGALRLMY